MFTVTNRQGRRLGLNLTQPSGSAWWQTNAYDAAGRLATLASPAGAFTYSYKVGQAASLTAGILLPTTGGTAYVTNFFDPTGRLTSTQLRSNDHSVISLHEYAYNAGHQRTVGTRTNVSVGTSYSLRTGYAYDDGGQLTLAWTTNSAGTLVGGESRGYGYAFAYNHENQCVTAGWYDAYNKSDFVYDGRGRLRKRTDYTWNGSSWNYTGETRYVYDGMLLVQERASANHPAVTYTRGSDLSGSLEGAGGIGGLLARTVHSGSTPYQPSAHACYHADGNGNVTYLLKSDRTHGASYKYDPYGRLITSSGTFASVNTMRFSSKEWHASASLYYYGYRFYVPDLQRWLNRDPIEEGDGLNIYCFLHNNSLNAYDPNGQAAHIAGGAILGCGVNAGWSLFTSVVGGDNFCQCTCKAFGSCAVGAVAGAIAVVQPTWSSCMIGLASGVSSKFVGDACDKMCGKPTPGKPICSLVSGIAQAMGGCLLSKLGINDVRTIERLIMETIVKVGGADIKGYCNFFSD